MKKTLIILIFILTEGLMYGQGFNYNLNRRYCFEYGVQIGFSQYRGEMNGFRNSYYFWNYNFAGGLFVRYNFDYDYSQTKLSKLLDKHFSMRLNVLHLNITGEDKNDDVNVSGLKIKTSINEVSGVLEYSFIKFSSSYKENIQGYPLTPYIFGGLGGFIYSIKDASTNENINQGNKFALCGIGGLGVKAGIYNGIIIDVNAGMRMCSTDNLDGNRVSGIPDIYYYFGGGLSFNIKQLKEK